MSQYNTHLPALSKADLRTGCKQFFWREVARCESPLTIARRGLCCDLCKAGTHHQEVGFMTIEGGIKRDAGTSGSKMNGEADVLTPLHPGLLKRFLFLRAQAWSSPGVCAPHQTSGCLK